MCNVSEVIIISLITYVDEYMFQATLGSGAHLALRNKIKFRLYIRPVSWFAALALMHYGAATFRPATRICSCLPLPTFSAVVCAHACS